MGNLGQYFGQGSWWELQTECQRRRPALANIPSMTKMIKAEDSDSFSWIIRLVERFFGTLRGCRAGLLMSGALVML